MIPNENGKDVFELESRDGKIVLRGNNGVGIASALNWYLEKSCHCQVSSCGSNLDLPDPLPVVPAKLRRVSPHHYRYTFNYCTFGYRMAFWDWERWEREIDFMALQGINAPLAVTGMEVVYRNVYRDLGLSEEEIGKFIAAPPFLPWFFMNNIDGWGGPIPEAWYVRQEALQKKILARQRELGMKPILTDLHRSRSGGSQKKIPRLQNPRPPWLRLPRRLEVLDPATRCSTISARVSSRKPAGSMAPTTSTPPILSTRWTRPPPTPLTSRTSAAPSITRWPTPIRKRSGSCRAGCSSTTPHSGRSRASRRCFPACPTSAW